ncbi:putative secologanin synthase [Helianthus debilis subsp. tardiflorus]
MVATMGNVVVTIVIVLIGRVGWKLLNWAWLKPRKLEKWMRSEGYKGNSYKLVIGDIKELAQTMKEGKKKSIPISHDIAAHVLPFDHQIITKYGIFHAFISMFIEVYFTVKNKMCVLLFEYSYGIFKKCNSQVSHRHVSWSSR